MAPALQMCPQQPAHANAQEMAAILGSWSCSLPGPRQGLCGHWALTTRFLSSSKPSAPGATPDP